MAPCDGFEKTWTVDWVRTGFPEDIPHGIEIKKLPSGKYRVRCLRSGAHTYTEATCNNGVLEGDSGYKIRLTSGTPNRITFIPPNAPDRQPGSWTANDSGGPLEPPE